MRKAFSVVISMLLLLGSTMGLRADSTWEFSVQLSATVQEYPAEIRLSWPQDTYSTPNSYTIYRKSVSSSSWGAGTTLPGSITSYTDQNVAAGTAYEYQVVKSAATYTGYGYITAGMGLPLVEQRGRVLLVVESSVAAPLSSELARLEKDLRGDGWLVTRLEASRDETAANVKSRIRAEYNADPANTKAAFLFGRIPVPYSGDITPDGHRPDHTGAWPADGYYGDMDGTWTDETVSSTAATEARNRNVPGDGKFDQSSFPSGIELMVGRVDMANMPGRMTWNGPATFPSELELLRNYLNKDHNFRQGRMDLPRRGIVGDYFGYREGEAFAASGWRNFSTFFGAENLTTLPNKGTWIPALTANGYLWAYGCGAGSYTSIGGLGNATPYNDGLSTDIVNGDIKAAFTLLFGSWLGDWDSEDNIMRAVLATPTHGLTSGWSGRPHWFAHHMALGETIGFSARLTQNNNAALYRNQLNSCAGQIHVALMGDPTLRMHPVAPARDVRVTSSGTGVSLSWTASTDTVVGYHVYRAANAQGAFTRLTQLPVTETVYTDSTPAAGAEYMVRAIKLETSASGTYYNASQGAFAQADGTATGGSTGSTVVTNSVQTGTETNVTTVTNSVPTTLTTNDVAWVDDALPAGALTGADHGDSWSWVSYGPNPYKGSRAHQSSIGSGLHQHYFYGATSTLTVSKDERLLTAVYLDPANPPREIMLQWHDGTWEHRAYWGENLINYGLDGTAGRQYMGPLPSAGQWARLEVPPALVGLESRPISGMAFSVYDGRAAWDFSGKTSVTASTNTTPGTVPSTNTLATVENWVEDDVPLGAVAGAEGGDSWNWVTTNPAPVSGMKAHQSSFGLGFVQHYFDYATKELTVNAGDVLFAWVNVDPTSPPDELMLQWSDGSWEHRAYWGENMITYGVNGTSNRRYMGPMPQPGQWTRLEVPASAVALEGRQVRGMAFTHYNGKVTWDAAGKGSASLTSGTSTNVVTVPPTTTTNMPPTTNPPVVVNTNTVPTTNPPVVVNTNMSSTTNIALSTNEIPGLSRVDYATLQLPEAGESTLHILTPNMLELKLINTKQPDPARVTQWDLVDNANQFLAPAPTEFTVTANGQPVGVTAVGFKRRPLYAPYQSYDLRIENGMYLQLASPVSDNQVIEVKNPTGRLWSPSMQFLKTTDPLRFSPAIHVNQEGYIPNYSKKAMVGYYLGNMGELNVPASAGFKIVNHKTGQTVYQGNLTQRMDQGYTYTPTPYQKVYEADFTAFNTPGQYRMVVPGMGGSLPFLIDSGIAMGFARTYALGLYHQRCGTALTMPHTRHTHDQCHGASASVPMPEANFSWTWNTVSDYARTLNSENPQQIAPALTSASAQLFPMIRQGTVDTSGGHHDAGDYSKYTINSASLVHYLMFAADSLPGVGLLDNMGIPESGDGISDVLQEAKWEADFLAKLQDADGGFYFLVYPKNRKYEAGTLPENGDAQVVWPKTMSATAASVAALAQCASSPVMNRAYPEAALYYMEKAQLGWQFIMSAMAKHGKTGAYQKITHYGDNYADQDELAWAATEMFVATGDASIHQVMKSWFNPADPATWRWGWWHMNESYGNAVRSYAFAARSGRLPASALDATHLAKCDAEIVAAGDANMNWSKMSAYGTSFPDATKRVKAAGWYFSTDQAFDIAVAHTIVPKADYMTAMLANMNYEGGCNPVNAVYLTGMGMKRQRDIVSQWATNDRRILPPSGIPIGNVQSTFGYLWNYTGMLEALSFPASGAATAPYPFYDRWGDSWNVSAEFVVLNQARSLGTLAFIAAQNPAHHQPWTAKAGKIVGPTATVPVGKPVTLTLETPGMDLSSARIVWEARDQEPGFGSSYTMSPKNNGVQWVEAEATWPDGRRVFALGSYNANSPNVVWFDDALPTGAATGADGGDTWNWVSTNPDPQSGTKVHQSAVSAGTHQHWFQNATATLAVGTGDVLYAWVYLDPANPPSQLMLQWNDGTWEHRAYWGSNQLSYGIDGTPSRRYMGPLPTTGQWIQLKVPAADVGLEGRTLSGMAFTLLGGRASWDATGRLNNIPPDSGTVERVTLSMKLVGGKPSLTWNSVAGGQYRVSYKSNLAETQWQTAADVAAASGITTWEDPTAASAPARFYMVSRIN